MQQFWKKAKIEISENGEQSIQTKVDGKLLTISESSIRRHLKLDDSDGISQLPDLEIFANLERMGYHTNSTQLKFQKKYLTPQWRFFIHTILHCLSQKKTSWEQFSGNMASALICLATNRKYNFSKYIFEGLVQNVNSKTKFLMYPRFLSSIMKMKKLSQRGPIYETPKLSHKVFSNMKIGFTGEEEPLFNEMLHPEEPTTSSESSSRSSAASISTSHQNSPIHAPTPSPVPLPTPPTSIHHETLSHSPQTLQELKDKVKQLEDAK
jgi:hypothetical protein